jgi:putative DNA primase/helicase
MKYFEQAQPDPMTREFLQVAIGMCLSGMPLEKAFFLLHGKGDTGKSVFMEVVGALFGTYGIMASPLVLGGKQGGSAHQSAQHALMGARFVRTPETKRDEELNAKFIKQYSGREEVTTRAAFGKMEVTWRPAGYIFNGSNHALRFDSSDSGVQNRLRVVTFGVSVPKEDQDERLPGRIRENELGAVLGWALEGLRKYYAGGLPVLESITEANANYTKEQSPVYQFVLAAQDKGLIEQKEGAGISFGDLYTIYLGWCKQEQIKQPLGKQQLTEQLTAAPLNWERYKSGTWKWRGWTPTVPVSTLLPEMMWHD